MLSAMTIAFALIWRGKNLRAHQWTIKAEQRKGDAALKSSVASFTADTAEKIGRSEPSVRRDAQRATKITHIADVIGTSIS